MSFRSQAHVFAKAMVEMRFGFQTQQLSQRCVSLLLVREEFNLLRNLPFGHRGATEGQPVGSSDRRLLWAASLASHHRAGGGPEVGELTPPALASCPHHGDTQVRK